jgi:hypothetical protein
MMSNFLQLWFYCDADGVGELFAQVESNGFSGRSSAWFGKSQIVEFATRLADAFPLPADKPLKLEGGFLSELGVSVVQPHVSLSFYPIGHLGLVGCRVLLATPIHSEDRLEEQSLVAIELKTHYELLRAFAYSLERMAKGLEKEVVLQAEPVSHV